MAERTLRILRCKTKISHTNIAKNIHITRFLKEVWPFFNVMYERAKQLSQLTVTCSKSTIETLEKDVIYVQS